MLDAVPTEDRPSLAVVVPVFNEAADIKRSISEIVSAAQEYRGRACVLAVDDGGTDGTGQIVDDLAAREPLLACTHHDANFGYGAACRTGADWAQANGYEYVAFIDSDLTNPPEDIAKIGSLAQAGAAYIKASRFMPGGRMADVPLRRQAFSRVGNRVAAALFRTQTRDVTNGFRAVRTELYAQWPLGEVGFSIIMEEMYQAFTAGITVASFPTTLRSRVAAQRGTSFTYTPRVLKQYLKYPIRFRLSRRHGSRNDEAHGNTERINVG